MPSRYLPLLFLLLASSARAGVIADSLGLTSALAEAKENVLAVGSIVVIFVAFLALVPVIIRVVKMADPRLVALDQSRVSFDGYKEFTSTPNARYGASYKRQEYVNFTVDSLYSHAEFLEFSARLREREVEWLKSQKDDLGIIDIETDISIAEQRMQTAEAVLEEVRSQIDFYEQNRELDIEDAEIVDESEVDYSNDSSESFWASVAELDDRERDA